MGRAHVGPFPWLISTRTILQGNKKHCLCSRRKTVIFSHLCNFIDLIQAASLTPAIWYFPVDFNNCFHFIEMNFTTRAFIVSHVLMWKAVHYGWFHSYHPHSPKRRGRKKTLILKSYRQARFAAWGILILSTELCVVFALIWWTDPSWKLL